MFLTAFMREGGAVGGGTRPPLPVAGPFGALPRPSSLDGWEEFRDEEVCWRAAAAGVISFFARDGSLGRNRWLVLSSEESVGIWSATDAP